MKNLSILVLGSLLSASVFALPNSNSANFIGPAVGVELGTTKYKLKDSEDLKSKNTADVNLTGSYGFEYGNSNFIGGIEGKAKLGNSKVFTTSDNNVKEKSRYSIGYTQGYRVTSDLMPYAKAQYQESKFKDDDDTDKLTARGYGIGVGAKYAINPNIEVGIEYMHSQEKTKKDRDGDQDKYKGNTVSTGVSYRF